MGSVFFRPRHYSLRVLAADVTAGAAVSLLALPLAMGLAISSNVSPHAGLVCAIAGGFVISAIAFFGGSRVQIGGPTAAFVLLTSTIVTRHGLDGLFICTIMAGAMLIALGATGMGTAVKYVPRPVVVGFTNGIALLLAVTQINDALGLRMPAAAAQAAAQAPAAADLVGRMTAIGLAIGTVHWPAAILTAVCLVAIILGARRDLRAAGATAAVGAGTLVTMMFGVPVETIASRFQDVPAALPGAWPIFHLPPPRWDLAWTLLPAAFAVAVLVAIESVMSAVEADHLSGDRHDPNVELVAHGVANIASPLFGGLPASSSIVRTAANIRAGARTPVAGVVHALALLLIVFAFAPLAGAIPLPVLTALLLSVAWSIGGWQELPSVLRASRADALAWLITVLLVLFADLTQAVPAAMALAGLLFIRTIASGTTGARVVRIGQDLADSGVDGVAGVGMTAEDQIPPYVAAFRLTGAFLFAGADILSSIVDCLDSLPPIVILRMDDVPATDATSLRAIEALADRIRGAGRVLLVCGAQAQPLAVMRRTRFEDRLGADNVCPAWREARARAKELFEERFQPGFPYGAVATAAAH
jgi:SulP family sulfate permease